MPPKGTFSVEDEAGVVFGKDLTRAAAKKLAMDLAKSRVNTWFVIDRKGRKAGGARVDANWYD